MAALKIWNGTTWVEVATIKGDQGETGDTGAAAFIHVRWAEMFPDSDDDISETPNDWMGIYTGTSTSAPTAYTAYAWVKVKGENGSGIGDMLKSVYDTDDDGKVDAAEDADKLGGVAASGYARDIIGQTEKLGIETTDSIALADSGDSYKQKKIPWLNVRSGLTSYFSTLYAGVTHKTRHASGGTDALLPADIGAMTNSITQIAFTEIDDADYIPVYDTSGTEQKKTLWSNIRSVLKTYFDTVYTGISATGSSTTNSTTGRVITHTFGSIAASTYRVIITPTLTAAPTTSTAGSLGEVYVVKNTDGTFTVYNTGIAGVAFDWQAFKV